MSTLPEQASGLWSRMEAKKRGLMDRVERYAALTIPKVCLPDGFDVESMDQTHDYQSIGAQATNHVVNKLMTAMFAPSRPFFRVTEGKKTKQAAAAAKMTETELAEVLAKMERDGALQLDKMGQRPKLYQACRHLVVTGNVLMILDKDMIRIMGLKFFCVKRNARGQVQTLIVRERVCFDELEEKVKDSLREFYKNTDQLVSHYRVIKKYPNGYRMTQHVDEHELDKAFSMRWTDEKMPYRVLTWDLADESDYATGLVEEYVGDFESASVLSEAVVTGAVVGTEFRWVANPSGMTSIEDFRNSVNGDTIPGNAKDITAISPPVAEAVKTAQAVNEGYQQRIARGFLMGSAVTRDAERVTAEEIRQQAMELESSFGGVYSALAPSMQGPIALWMLSAADTPIAGTDLGVMVLTGLDALSRNGDLENLKQGILTLGGLLNVPPMLQERIKWQELATFVGQGVGVELARFVMTDAEYSQMKQQQMAQQGASEAATAGGVAQAEASAQPEQ